MSIAPLLIAIILAVPLAQQHPQSRPAHSPLATATQAVDEDEIDSWRERLSPFTTEALVAVLADSDAQTPQRIAAERILCQRGDPEALLLIFRMFDEFVGPGGHIVFDVELNGRAQRVTPHWPGFGSAGSAEQDARLPPNVQVFYALKRVWSHIADHGSPREERTRICEALIEHAATVFHEDLLLWAARGNWSSRMREFALSVYLHGENDDWHRLEAAHTLIDMYSHSQHDDYAAIHEQLISTAWRERKTSFARLMAERLHFRDPRIAVLKMDLYDHERSAPRPRMTESNLADLIEGFFGDITGKYVHAMAPRIDEEDAIITKRSRLERLADLTGDRTQLDEFEAEVAAQRQAVLDERLAVIDAWIKENRQRLETEAIIFEARRIAERSVERGVDNDEDDDAAADRTRE